MAGIAQTSNAVMEQLISLASESLHGKSLSQLFHGISAEEIRHTLQTSGRFQDTLTAALGSEATLMATITPLRDENNGIHGFVIFAMTINKVSREVNKKSEIVPR